MAKTINTRPIDIEVWSGDAEFGEFPGLHWEEVRQHPTAADLLPYRATAYCYGPYDSLAEVVRSVERTIPEGHLRTIYINKMQIPFGPDAYTEVLH